MRSTQVGPAVCVILHACRIAVFGITISGEIKCSAHPEKSTNACVPDVQGPLPATPPGKATPEQQQPEQWAASSPIATQLWARWFRDLGALCLLLLSLWLLRRALRDTAAAAGSSTIPGFWQGSRVVLLPGTPRPLLEALPAVTSQ